MCIDTCIQSLYAVTSPHPPRKKNPVWNPGYRSGPKNRMSYKKEWPEVSTWCYARPLTFTVFPGVDIKWCTQQQCYWGLLHHLAPPPHPCGHWFHQHLLLCYYAPEPDTLSTVWDLRWGVCKAYIIWTAGHWNMSCLRICPSVMNFSSFQKKRIYIWLITWTTYPPYCHVHSIILA